MTVKSVRTGGLHAKALGEYIKERRRLSKMTQVELAAISGTDQKNISMLERGLFHFMPMPDTLNGIAYALGIPVAWLFNVAGYNGTDDEPSGNR